jgi:hypothetical protein
MMAVGGLEADEPPERAESARLLRLAKTGDLAAFERIIIRHERQVFMTALRLLSHYLKFEISRIEPMQIEPMRIDPPPAPNQLVVKLVTDDPEVVIIWLIDQKQNGG